MTHSGVPFLAVHDFRVQIHRIVGKDLLDLLLRDIMAGDVRSIRFIPIENQVVRRQIPIYIRRMYTAKSAPDGFQIGA